MATETLHTATQYKYKHNENLHRHNEKWTSLFSFKNRSTFPPLEMMCLIFTLDLNHVCIVFTTGMGYCRTEETFGTGPMHNINKCKQVSDSQINQKIHCHMILQYPLPHALHNSFGFPYITYMLHSLTSYFTDIKANISMQSGSCSAFLYI